MNFKFAGLGIVLFVCALVSGSAVASDRVAIVVGNGAYAHSVRLPNPTRDAQIVATALKALDFDVVQGTDLDRNSMEKLLRTFLRKAETAKVALFFYAGHGLQVDGRNYLLPIDAKLEVPSDLPYETIKLDELLDNLASPTRANIIVLDACRDNPLSRGLASRMGASRSAAVGRGLAPYSNVGTGTLIAFSTAPGQTALDGDGSNSPFATSFVRHINSPGVEVRQLLTRVRADVAKVTQNVQIPWDNSSLMGEVYLAGLGPTSNSAPPSQSPDEMFWAAIKDSKTAGIFQEFITSHPNSRHVNDAKSKLAALTPSAKEAPSITQIAPKSELSRVDSGVQRAVLYVEDPKVPTGVQTTGHVRWKRSPAVGKEPSFVFADVRFGNGLEFDIAIKLNIDASLPASHTVELTARVPRSLHGGQIENMPGLLMKANEQTRGTPLAGLAVKVTNNFFLIGLSSVEADRRKNTDLLRERSWFDLPLVFSDKRRAILAIEKGEAGTTLLAQHLSEWQKIVGR